MSDEQAPPPAGRPGWPSAARAASTYQISLVLKYTYVYVCIYIYIYTYIHTYMHTYTYTHTCILYKYEYC